MIWSRPAKPNLTAGHDFWRSLLVVNLVDLFNLNLACPNVMWHEMATSFDGQAAGYIFSQMGATLAGLCL